MSKTVKIVKANGEIQCKDYALKQLDYALGTLANGEYALTISKLVKKRTISQNALFHTWISVIADAVGYTSNEDCKRDAKRHILGQKEVANRLTGAIEKEDYKTSEMSVADLQKFMDKMKVWAMQDFGIYLPYFGDVGYEEMINEYSKKSI
jgi:hypothetical protein